ncbi:MAG TPA: DUF4169 family protein [Methylomirabilota bacterium]|nr:DUF4169 family protein [Methylomirabilota bacterium]
MGDVINLRLRRKRKDRTTRETRAAENRVKFGRTKAEKERERTVAEIEARRLDEHRLPEDEITRPKSD